MKAFKSLFSITIALTIVFCIGISALADSSSYSIEIPDGFTPFDAQGQDAAWKNADGSIIINLAISENTSNVKVNPNDAGKSYMELVENELKASVVSTDKFSGEIVESNSSLMELGEHDAIRVYMHARYTFQSGEMNVYQICYLFETQNYIHSFVVTGDENIVEFGDKLIKTVKISDEAIPLRDVDLSDGIPVFGWAIIGAGVGAVIGLALTLVAGLIKNKAQKETPTSDEESE